MSDDRTNKILSYYAERVAQYGTSGHATLLDDNLRILEIETASNWLRDDDRLLDIFCGNGVSTLELAGRCKSATGFDLSDEMLDAARKLQATGRPGADRVTFVKGNVLELEPTFGRDSFDAVTSIRGIINLPTWEMQQSALRGVHSVLAPGGRLVLIEGDREGLDSLNALRGEYSLPPIQMPWYDRYVDRDGLLEFTSPMFELVEKRDLSTYFLLSRLLHPLAVSPDEPRFDSPSNKMARLALEYLQSSRYCSIVCCLLLQKKTASA